MPWTTSGFFGDLGNVDTTAALSLVISPVFTHTCVLLSSETEVLDGESGLTHCAYR